MTVAETRQVLVFQGENIRVVDEHFAGIRFVQCADYLQKRGFSGTGFADNRNNLTFVNMKINSAQHMQRVKGFLYVLNVNHSYFFL